MTNVMCDSKNGKCSKDPGVLYDESPEYKEEFWVATKKMLVIDERTYREKRFGKKIIVDSHVFYTDDDRYFDCYLTEARTGMGVGSLYYVRNNIQKIMERAAEFPDVMSYPNKIILEDQDFIGFLTQRQVLLPIITEAERRSCIEKLIYQMIFHKWEENDDQ